MQFKNHPDYQAEHQIKIKKYKGETDVSPFGAFRETESVILSLSVPARCGAFAFTLLYTSADCEKVEAQRRSFTIDSFGGREDTYICPLPTEKEALYFYQIEYRDEQGAHYVINPLTGTTTFQLTVYAKDYTPPSFLKGGVIYHIFVDRFYKSGCCAPKSYAKMAQSPNDTPQFPEKPGDPLANDLFFGGDLYGIIEKLDYLVSLGVTCLYISPIFEARSNHKYDTGCYMHVDSMFGGDEALQALIAEADKRNIKIILDGVFNHTGDDSLYFNKYGHYSSTGAFQSKDSPYYDWYTFSNYPTEYHSWWGIDILPTTNKNSPSFQEYIYGEKGVIAHYIEQGIAGWRLDVADELPDDFLTKLTKRAKQANPKCIIIGEVWEDASHKIAYSKRRQYFRGHELDSVTNYPLRNAIIDFIKNGDGTAFARSVLTQYANYPKCVSDNLMNLLGTHDTERILTVLGGKEAGGASNQELANRCMTPEERKKGIQRLKLAFTLCATLPGVPCIYYGDEAGLEGYHDPFNRRFFPWGREDSELLSFYQSLCRLRGQEEAFKEGLLTILLAEQHHIVYQRDEIVIAINQGDTPFYFDSEHLYYNLITQREEKICLEAWQAGIYKIKQK
ncbi:MAG: glycoside hydrolase family 13 protein [Clostridiales bacterium]|nr:glycoside hydrolase family 13 protein [Clostridiales bacterium]